MKNKKRLILSLAVTITLTTGSAYLPSAFAESSTDPAPEITAKVINQNNGKKYYLITLTVKRPEQLIGLSMVVFLILEMVLLIMDIL